MINNSKLIVPEREKTPAWIKERILEVQKIGKSSNHFKKDIICFNYYNNIHNSKDFNYFTEVAGRVLPAELNHIPLQRNLLNSLISEYTIRPFIFSILLSDDESIDKKQKNKLNEYLKRLELILKQQIFMGDEQVTQMQQQMDQLTQMANQEPQNEEDAQKIQQIKQQLPQMNIQFKMTLDMIQEGNADMDTQLGEIERYLKYDYREPEEQAAQKILRYYFNKYQIKAKGTECFTNQTITGNQYYYVDIIEGDVNPTFEALSVLSVTYPSIVNVNWVQDGPWAKIEEAISYPSLVAEYGDELKKKYGEKVLEELTEDNSATTSGGFASTPDGAMYDGSPSSGTSSAGGIAIERIWYKSPVQIKIKLSPNQYEKGEYFRHFIDKYKKVIDRKDFEYRSGKYVNKTDKSIKHNSKDVEDFDSRKGQKVKTKYSNDLYKGVVIAGKYVVGEGKVHSVVRNVDDYSDIKIPIVGRSYNMIDKRPYSIIWATKGLQDAYNKVYYHRELMMNLAGTKSIIYDRSQKPTDMTDAEWEEQKKMGNINIQTVTADGNPIRTNFNQWQSVDLTLSPAVQYLTNMMAEIKETMGDIIGVPRQRVGLTVASDQVGTYERSLERSMVITEILYYDSDEVLARALTQLIQLATNYTYKDGGVFQYVAKDLGSDIISIPKGLFKKKRSFDVFVLNNNEEAKALKDLKDMLLMGYKDGQLPYDNLISTWTADSVSELESKVKYFTEEARKLSEKARAAEGEQAMAIQQQQIKLQQEFEGYWKEQEIGVDKAKMELDGNKNQIDSEISKQDLLLQDKKIEVDKYLKLLELANEQESEAAVVAENARGTNISARMKALELQLNAMLQMDDQDERKRDNKEKIKTEKMKVSKMNKEHTSDR